jgi:pentatricopeptide repeat protein
LYSYTIVVDGLCTNGRLRDAQEVYQVLLNKGYHLDARIYNVVINGLCKEGFCDEVLSLF